MVENNERPEIPRPYAPSFTLTTDEIKEQTKQEGEDFIQMLLAFREEELRLFMKWLIRKTKVLLKPSLIQCLVFWWMMR